MTNLPKLRELVAARTPGPWERVSQQHIRDVLGDNLVALIFAGRPESEIDANAKFIAVMGTIADDLIAVVEAARDLNEKYTLIYEAQGGLYGSPMETLAKVNISAPLDSTLKALENRLTAIFGEAK